MKKWSYEHSTMCYDVPGPYTGQRTWTHNGHHMTGIIDPSVPPLARIYGFRVNIESDVTISM